MKDKLFRDRKYICPFYGEEVIFRKVEKNQHHFSHKADTNCNPASETILHFEAKHYLVRELNNQNDVYCSIPIDYFGDKYKEMFNALNQTYYDISLLDFLRFYKAGELFVKKRSAI
ncbi:hypothetical protein HFZ78_19190 [Priestia megaterium]|uniref:Competence protein CoiA-like N-terminal domain-containing protein n=1 Tax=Priestia megaterium TaxID=1404 RepID=A0A6H1PCC0_PRIMG|nr:competence protein CoiA family protein [Priestia megaterium]QIZ11027.1 hypothetical protein HFZ78_19190 [Priestia megaterium]